ncbi:Ig-like domain-containing protein [Candidatus Marinimicrobia bacterium]|nr:Ig-like domain-containing protein [Candidatus Neomarinimicrobiota bacterium]
MYKASKFNYMFLLIFILSQVVIFGQAIDFYPAGQTADGDNIYNINSTVATNGPFSGSDAGGVYVQGSSLAFTSWDVQIQFDGGAFTTINGDPSDNGDAAGNGQSFGAGTVRPTADGDLNMWFSHAHIAATSGYPGTVDGINISFRIKKVSDASTLPTSPQDYAFDLVAPTLTSASIASDNSNTSWAKSGDNITITLTAPSGSDGENLGTSDQWTTSIQGLGATVSGSGLVWTVSTTVSTHPEGTVYFQITYYDAYENSGTLLTAVVGNTSQVIIDKTPPNIAATILSNDNANNTQYLATTGDDVTLTITATDDDGGAETIQVPTVTIDGNTPTGSDLSVPASSYTAYRTMQASDTQGAVGFSITGIADRAGNTATNVTAVTSGSNVRFDSAVPTINALTVLSNNAIASNKATIGDVITISFSSTGNESLQTPVVLIDGEAADEQQNGNAYTWTATKAMDAEDTERLTQFSLNFKDLAANSGVALDHGDITSGTLVDFDATTPTINSESASTTNSFNNTLAILNQVISIDIESAEELYSVKDVLIAGKAVANQTTAETNVTDWTINHVVDGTEADGYVGYSYTAVDLAGNETDVVKSSSSIRIDNSKPVLSTVTIISNNTNTAYAKINDVVTINIVANEALRIDPVVSIQGRAATIAAAGDGITFTATHTMDNTDTEGLIAFQIDFENTFGLAGDRIIDDGSGGSTNNGATVTFDRAAPTLNPVTVLSNNANPLYAKVGDIITLSFNSNEAIQDPPTVVFLSTPGDNRAGTVSGSGTTWNATYTMQNSDTEGDVDFYIDFVDISGNTGTRETSLSSGSEIIFDRDIPELTTIDISSSNANPALSKVGDVITLAITADEGIQIPTVTIAGSAIPNSAITGNDGERNFTATYTMQSSDNTTAALGFTIDFSDLANNAGTQRTTLENDGDGLNVGFDKQDPGLDIITMFSDNDNRAGTGNKTGLAIVNDIITVNFESDEDLKTGVTPAVLIAGNAATVVRNADNDYTATYQMASDDDTDGANITISISNLVDPAGNSPASAITSTTDGSYVKFDKTNPTLGSITIASNNLDNTLAIQGQVITLTFASTEDISVPTVNILGGAAVVTNVADSSNWVATKTVGGADSEGVVGFSIAYSDKAGNNGTTRTDITGGDDPVTVDLTIPQVTKASIATNNGTGDELSVPGDVVTLNVETSEAIQAPTILIATQSATVVQGADALTWIATYTMTTNESNGAVNFAIDFMDLAGNRGNGGASYTAILNDDDGNTVSFDKTQPQLDLISIQSDNTLIAYARVGSEVTLSFESNEALSSYSVTINGNAAAVSYDAAADRFSAAYTLVDGDTEGDVAFTIDYTDLNGYQGVQQTETLDDSNVEFDKTPPEMSSLIYSSNNANLTRMAQEGDVITVEINTNENIQSPTITLATNPSGTPVAGGTEAIWSSNYTVPSLSDGVVALQVDFKDYAGNSGTRQVAPLSGDVVTYDGTSPALTTVTLVSNNNYSTAKAKLFDELTLTIVAGESIQTPVITISGTSVTPEIGVDDENWTATYIMQNADAEIDIPFTIDFKDLADNAGTQVVATTGGEIVNYDNTAPITTGLIVDLKDASDTGLLNNDNITTVLTPTFEIQNLTSGPALGAGEKLILNINGVDYDSLTITVDAMSIAVPDASPLTNNVLPYEVTAFIRDLAGNLSLASSSLNITVDTESPLTNGVLNLTDLSDTGSDNADEITSDNTPTLEVNGLADGQIYTVQIEYDLEGGASNQLVIDQLMAQAITDQFTTTALSDGVYTFTYKLVDTAGNISSESNPVIITIDRTQPTIPTAPDLTDAYDTGTLNSDNLTNLADLEFSISNLVIGESLEIYDDADNSLLGTKTITATTETIIINGFTEGAHVVYAKITDLAGNQCGETGLLAFEVDLTAIDVTGITMDLNSSDDSGALDDDELTNVNTPSLTISTVSTNDIVKIYATNVLVGTATSTGTSVSVTSSVLIDNPYVMSFTVTDYAGNVSLVSDNTLPITIDTTPWEPPVDLVLQFDTGADASDNVTNDQTPTFRISSGLDFAELDLIRLYSNDGVSNTLIESTRKTASKTFHDITVPDASALGEGSYDFTYDIVDYAGNVSLNTSAALTIIVDVTAPLYILNVDLDDATDSGGDPLDATDPLTIDNLTNSSNLSITLSGFTAGDYAQLYYTYSVSGITNIVEPNGLVSVGDAGSKTYQFPHIGDGAYTIIGYSADLAGNDNTAVTLVVTVDTTPPDASLVTLDLMDASDTGGDPTDPTDPLTIDNLTNVTTPNILISNVSVTDSVTLYNDDVNNSVKARGLPAASTITLAQDLTAAADAAITFYATLKDAAGNESIASPVPLVVTLDTTAPLSGTTPPLPDLTDATDTGEFPADNKTYIQNPSFDLTLTGAFQPDSLILYAQTGITKSIVGRSIKVLNQEFGTIAVALGKELAEAADYTITYKLIDAAGNISAESAPLTPLQVDLTFPDVPGDPNLEPLSDTGKSDSDNITNASTISIDMPGITSGLIGKLYTFTDVNGDGIFDFDDWGPDGIQSNGDFGEGNGAYDEGEPSTESPTIVVADYSDNNAEFENWYLNDWALSGNDADCGCLDGSLTYNYATIADDSLAIGFFTIHEDLVGQRKQSANALIVQADRKTPVQNVTVAYSDADFLVNSSSGTLTYTFTYKEELDSQLEPPRFNLRFPTSANLENQPLVYTGSNNIWKYDLALGGYNNDNGLIIAEAHFAQDLAGNDIATPVWSDITIDNLPADFTDITPISSSFNNILNNFGWTLNENLDPLAVNAINFYQDDAVVATYPFSVAELSLGVRANGNLGAGFALADGVYTVSFETTDIVGNVGKVDITNYSYDTKSPSVTMTYSREVVTADSLVTITATFDEPVTNFPIIELTAMDSLVAGASHVAVPMTLPGGCECLDDNGDVIPNCEPEIDEATCTDINGFNGTWDLDYFGVTDGSVWIYHYIAPGIDDVDLSITNSGPLDVFIRSTDLASNPLYMVDNAVSGITNGFDNASPLYIDNDKTQATYSYLNLSNSTIVDASGSPTTYAGAGGDTIEVTITLNQPILTSNPVPELRYTYGSGTGTGISGISFVSVADIEDGVDASSIDPLTEANLIWKYNLIIPDLAEWDGAIDFNFLARDLSNVLILEENEITDSEFIVDNIHPADFETGIVTVSGVNPVQGYITGFIDVISLVVPIPGQIEDPTIINGEVKVEFFNLNRGVDWVTIGANSSITEVGELLFNRNIADVYTAMPQGTEIITGDQISVRASLIDRNGNITIGSESITQMAYDPTSPVMGTVTGGNFSGELSPQYSNDLVSLEWSEFLETDEGESGVETYEILIRKLADGDCDCLDGDGAIIAECEASVDYTVCVSAVEDSGFASTWSLADVADSVLIDWTNVLPPTTSFEYNPILEHNQKYRAFVRATDVAGNISTTLSSDILYRLNSSPIISSLEPAILNEDLFWSDTLLFTDLDLNIQQGDQFTFEVITSLQEGATPYLESGSAQGGSVSEIILASTASPQDNFYNGTVIKLVDELEDSLRTILDYDGTSKVATISDGFNDWSNPPVNGTSYEITRGSVSIAAYTPEEGDSGIERYAILSWKPSQIDVNSYDLSIRVNDAYNHSDTLPLILSVNAVNDPPSFDIPTEKEIVEWNEDQSAISPVTFNLSRYLYDVDNDISTEMTWQAIIYDTSQIDEGFPFGQVIVGPGTPKSIHADLLKQYIGFDIYSFDSKKNSSSNGSRISQKTLTLMNLSAESDPLLNITIDDVQYGNGAPDSSIATFFSAADYYGSNHMVEFVVQDLSGSEKRDTITVNVLPENDPPKIDVLENKFISENDSLKLEFGSFTTDIDDTSLTFTVKALRVNRQSGLIITDESGEEVLQDSITITPNSFSSSSLLDSVLFSPDKLWSHKTMIRVIASDGVSSDSSSFMLDIERVLRPHLTVAMIQNTAFSRFLQVIVTDTASKSTRISMEIQNQDMDIDTIAAHTYVSNLSFESSGNYSVDIFANASVGDTTINEFFSLVAGRASSRWVGRSYDGNFGISGDPGAVSYDQPFLIADSTLFEQNFHDRASYIFGNEEVIFNKPVEVRLYSNRSDLAIYRRKNGVVWEELPSLNIESEIFTLTTQGGYFKLGPKTIIVPERTSIHQNYPNPFNPTTTIKYDIGLMDGLSQNVSIDVYNLLGQHVKSLIKEVDQIGQFSIKWDGQDTFGQQMSSGVYFIQLSTETGIIKNKKMMLLK